MNWPQRPQGIRDAHDIICQGASNPGAPSGSEDNNMWLETSPHELLDQLIKEKRQSHDLAFDIILEICGAFSGSSKCGEVDQSR